jgi:C1A family cysteine protease
VIEPHEETMQRKYLLRTDRTDTRDHVFHAAGLPISARSDLTAGLPPAFDQGQLGSCTANAWAGALAFVHHEHIASRLMIYFGERDIEGTVGRDAGAQIRDGAKFLSKVGACPEADWPYVVSRFTRKPAARCYAEAGLFKIASYQRLLSLNDILACLSSGRPVVIGISVYETFEGDDVARSGYVPMPVHGEKNLGGHAVLVVGHDKKRQLLRVRNSWGARWGLQGDFWLPFAYITTPGLADDFWMLSE